MKSGKVRKVFLTFERVRGDLAFVREFKIGGTDYPNSGRVFSASNVIFNDNNDYIPGGNATFNTDIDLHFDGKAARGTYKDYRFRDGYGGYGESDPSTLFEKGAFALKKCRVDIIDQ